jgi:uncharacterized tellurite resistance protein B-like protein
MLYQKDEKYTFFSVMANDLGASKEQITKAAQALVDAKDREAAAFYSAESQLRRVLTPMHEKVCIGFLWSCLRPCLLTLQ